MYLRFIKVALCLSLVFSMTGVSKTRIQDSVLKKKLLAGSLFAGDSPKIGEVDIKGHKSQFLDFFSQLELARFLFSVMRPGQAAQDLDVSLHPEKAFDRNLLKSILEDGRYTLVFAVSRASDGFNYQKIKLIAQESEFGFLINKPLTGRHLIKVRPDPHSRVVRVLYADLENSFTEDESKSAKKTLGLSHYLSDQPIADLADLYEQYEVNQKIRSRLAVVSKVVMGSLSVFFGYLAYKAVMRKPAGSHGCASGCGHHHHGSADLAMKWHLPFKIFDSIVFSAGSFAWGAHALELHEKAEDLRNGTGKKVVERLLHTIEIGALTLGLTKGGLALIHLLLPEKAPLSKGAKSFLAASAVSGHDMQQVIFLSTFLMCPFDEILGSVPLAWLGGALDIHRTKQVWSHHSDFAQLPAIVHTHGFIPWMEL